MPALQQVHKDQPSPPCKGQPCWKKYQLPVSTLQYTGSKQKCFLPAPEKKALSWALHWSRLWPVCCSCWLNGMIKWRDSSWIFASQTFLFAILDAGAFEDLAGLQTLMEEQVEKCDYGFVCLLCTKAIKGKQEMRRHMREQHMRPREYRCPPCGLAFKNRQFFLHVNKYHPDWRGMNLERFRIDK